MSDASNGSGLREHLLVFTRFLRSPRTVGAFAASSRALAETVVSDLDFSGPTRIVELGPGTGALTRTIVDRLGSDDRFLAIDVDPQFVREIRQHWPTVEVVCASAEELAALLEDRGMAPVDHVISGLPFASLPGPVTDRILRGVADSLRPGGTFTTFQYFYSFDMPTSKAFRRRMSELMRRAPRKRLVVRNLPPAWILRWQKV